MEGYNTARTWASESGAENPQSTTNSHEFPATDPAGDMKDDAPDFELKLHIDRAIEAISRRFSLDSDASDDNVKGSLVQYQIMFNETVTKSIVESSIPDDLKQSYFQESQWLFNEYQGQWTRLLTHPAFTNAQKHQLYIDAIQLTDKLKLFQENETNVANAVQTLLDPNNLTFWQVLLLNHMPTFSTTRVAGSAALLYDSLSYALLRERATFINESEEILAEVSSLQQLQYRIDRETKSLITAYETNPAIATDPNFWFGREARISPNPFGNLQMYNSLGDAFHQINTPNITHYVASSGDLLPIMGEEPYSSETMDAIRNLFEGNTQRLVMTLGSIVDTTRGQIATQTEQLQEQSHNAFVAAMDIAKEIDTPFLDEKDQRFIDEANEFQQRSFYSGLVMDKYHKLHSPYQTPLSTMRRTIRELKKSQTEFPQWFNPYEINEYKQLLNGYIESHQMEIESSTGVRMGKRVARSNEFKELLNNDAADYINESEYIQQGRAALNAQKEDYEQKQQNYANEVQQRFDELGAHNTDLERRLQENADALKLSNENVQYLERTKETLEMRIEYLGSQLEESALRNETLRKRALEFESKFKNSQQYQQLANQYAVAIEQLRTSLRNVIEERDRIIQQQDEEKKNESNLIRGARLLLLSHTQQDPYSDGYPFWDTVDLLYNQDDPTSTKLQRFQDRMARLRELYNWAKQIPSLQNSNEIQALQDKILQYDIVNGFYTNGNPEGITDLLTKTFEKLQTILKPIYLVHPVRFENERNRAQTEIKENIARFEEEIKQREGEIEEQEDELKVQALQILKLQQELNRRTEFMRQLETQNNSLSTMLDALQQKEPASNMIEPPPQPDQNPLAEENNNLRSSLAAERERAQKLLEDYKNANVIQSQQQRTIKNQEDRIKELEIIVQANKFMIEELEVELKNAMTRLPSPISSPDLPPEKEQTEAFSQELVKNMVEMELKSPETDEDGKEVEDFVPSITKASYYQVPRSNVETKQVSFGDNEIEEFDPSMSPQEQAFRIRRVTQSGSPNAVEEIVKIIEPAYIAMREENGYAGGGGGGGGGGGAAAGNAPILHPVLVAGEQGPVAQPQPPERDSYLTAHTSTTYRTEDYRGASIPIRQGLQVMAERPAYNWDDRFGRSQFNPYLNRTKRSDVWSFG